MIISKANMAKNQETKLRQKMFMIIVIRIKKSFILAIKLLCLHITMIQTH